MENYRYSAEEILRFGSGNGMIDTLSIQDIMEMKERKEYLSNHPYQIWQGTNGAWYTYIPCEGNTNNRIQKKRNTRKEIENLIINYWKEKENNPTVKELFYEWIDRKYELKKISKSTYDRYEYEFKRYFGELEERKVSCVDPIEWQEFLEEQIPLFNLSNKAFNNLKTILRGMLKRAKKQKYISYNVEEMLFDVDVTDIDFRKTIKEDYEEVFDETEMPKVIDYLMDNLDLKNLGILLLFLTGMRIGELVCLRKEDLNDYTIKIRRTETRYLEDGNYIYEVKDFPKSEAGVRSVIIPKDYWWIAARIEALPYDGYIFQKKGRRYTTNVFRTRLKLICNKLDVYQKSPHKIRKTYGSILLDNGVDKRFVTDVMGHTDITITENHYHRNRKSLDKKIDIISQIPEFDLQLTKINQNRIAKTQ